MNGLICWMTSVMLLSSSLACVAIYSSIYRLRMMSQLLIIIKIESTSSFGAICSHLASRSAVFPVPGWPLINKWVLCVSASKRCCCGLRMKLRDDGSVLFFLLHIEKDLRYLSSTSRGVLTRRPDVKLSSIAVKLASDSKDLRYPRKLQ